MGIEALGGAPPVMLGIAVILWVLSLCIPAWGDAYIRIRTFHDSRVRDLRLVPEDRYEHKAIGNKLRPVAERGRTGHSIRRETSPTSSVEN